jgi:hypothetical protein
MPESHSLPKHIDVYIHRPACPKCHTHMILARIMPASVMGFDLRMFECPKCDYAHQVIVENDAFGRP